MSQKSISYALFGLSCLLGTLSAQPFEYSADYVIVGAGAGGSVLAARLAEAGKTVILLEAGPDTSLESNDQLVQFDKSLIDIPLNFISLWNRFNQDPNGSQCGGWNATQPLAEFVSVDQNGIYYNYPRGVGAGGSVSHHAMQDGVGSLEVYDQIAKTVHDKYWCGKNMKRLFSKMENTLFPHGQDCGSDAGSAYSTPLLKHHFLQTLQMPSLQLLMCRLLKTFAVLK